MNKVRFDKQHHSNLKQEVLIFLIILANSNAKNELY